MERVFGLNANITKMIIAVSAFMILGMIFRIIAYGGGKPHFQVISPNGDYHLTTEIVEKDGCVIFYDEFNIETRVCGSYSIKKL